MEYLTEISRTGPAPITLDDALEDLRLNNRMDHALVTRNAMRAIRYVEDRAQLTLYPTVQRKLSFPGWIPTNSGLWRNWWGLWSGYYSNPLSQSYLLTMPPYVSTDSVIYYDVDNDPQTVNAANYRTTDAGDAPAVLEWDEDWTFPSLKRREDAVQVTYTTGTGDPDPVAITAATLMISFLVDQDPAKKVAADDLIGDMRNTSYGQAPLGQSH